MTFTFMVHNKTEEILKVRDYYVMDPKQDLGYYGLLKYRIDARGKRKIRFSDFIDELMKEKKAQQIHVQRGENKPKVFQLKDFEENEGKDLFLEMGDDGDLRERFDTREEDEVTIAPSTESKAIAKFFRGMRRFLGAGTNQEARGMHRVRGTGTSTEASVADVV